jgi:hypothetical protein
MELSDPFSRLLTGDQTSKQVLDAFFLGRALAETINERLGSALGELISEVSRRQAEQQQFVREFQVKFGCFYDAHSLCDGFFSASPLVLV